MPNTETTTHEGRTVLLDFVRVKLLHPTTNEYVTVTPVELKADADLLAEFLGNQVTSSQKVRRPYVTATGAGGYKLDGDDDIVNRKGNKFKVNWEADESLPDYNFTEMFGNCLVDQGAAV